MTVILELAALVSVAALTYFLGHWLLRRKTSSERGQQHFRTRPNVLVTALAGVIPLTGKKRKAISIELQRAGLLDKWALVRFCASRNVLVIGCIIGTAALMVLADPKTNDARWIFISGAVFTAASLGIPRLGLQIQASRRIRRIQLGLPDALDLLSLCLSGGYSVERSMNEVCKQLRGTHDDLAVELDVVSRHSKADSFERALSHFAERVDIPDVRGLTSVISNANRTGTEVSRSLIEYADRLRLITKQRAESRANSTTVAMLFPVVFCLAPPIFILLLGPPVVQLKNFVGKERQTGGVLSSRDITAEVSEPQGSINRQPQ